MKVGSEKELGQAVRDGVDRIEIEGDLAKKAIRIHATGKVAWAVCFGAIGVAVTAVVITAGTAGASTPGTGTAGIIAGSAAAAVLGPTVAISAISIAVAGGGVGVLNKLRKYKLIKNGNIAVLEKK